MVTLRTNRYCICFTTASYYFIVAVTAFVANLNYVVIFAVVATAAVVAAATSVVAPAAAAAAAAATVVISFLDHGDSVLVALDFCCSG